MSGWIGFDLDGTLVEYTGVWSGPEEIGTPIPTMIDLAKSYLKKGMEIRIFTARAEVPECVPYVEKWAEKTFGQKIKVTNQKDLGMLLLYDDRAVSVKFNKGIWVNANE